MANEELTPLGKLRKALTGKGTKKAGPCAEVGINKKTRRGICADPDK